MTSTDTATMNGPAARSYFDQLGGTPTVKEAVDRFYRRVLEDAELAGYFAGTDLAQLKAHQVKLISHVLGGPNEYGGRELADAHSRLGVTAAHYAKVGGYLTGVLSDMGASEEIVGAVGAALAAVQPQIVASDGAASAGGAA